MIQTMILISMFSKVPKNCGSAEPDGLQILEVFFELQCLSAPYLK